MMLLKFIQRSRKEREAISELIKMMIYDLHTSLEIAFKQRNILNINISLIVVQHRRPTNAY